jgi:hypothetical protein
MIYSCTSSDCSVRELETSSPPDCECRLLHVQDENPNYNRWLLPVRRTDEITVFWAVTLVDRYHPQDSSWRQLILLKCSYLSTSLYGVRPQKTVIKIFTAVRTSNLWRIALFTAVFSFLYLSVSSHDETKENQQIYYCYDAEQISVLTDCNSEKVNECSKKLLFNSNIPLLNTT